MTTRDFFEHNDATIAVRPFLGIRVDAKILQTCTIVFDAAFILTFGVIADQIIFGYEGWWGDCTSLSVIVTLIFILTLCVRHGCRIGYPSGQLGQVVQIAIAWFAGFVILVCTAFLYGMSVSVPIVFMFLISVSGFAGLTIIHALVAATLKYMIRSGYVYFQRVFALVDAENGFLEQARQDLRAKGIHLAGHYVIPSTSPTVRVDGTQFGQKLRDTFDGSQCDAVLVFASWSNLRPIEELLDVIRRFPVSTILVANHLPDRVDAPRRINFADLDGFEIQCAPLGRSERVVKRCFDIVVASMGIILLLVPMVVACLAIMIETGRPVLFRQHRKGFGGRVFEILKFRTMTVCENGDCIVQASRQDPRVTPLGAVLRRTSIDELPQLLNVLRGEMSIVGPRPHALAHDNKYDKLIAAYALRRHVKPGMTGWAQINGLRGETRELGDMEARVEHDIWYINHWSIWLDLRILVRTAAVVLLDKNAF